MFNLVKQPMRLNYYASSMQTYISVDIDMDAPGIIHWLHAMVGDNPDTIFFFTVETTDIFEKKWDFNEVAMPRHDPPLPADHMGPEFNHGFHYESIFIQDSTKPPVL